MEHNLINDIAICIVVAWVLAVGAQLLRQPLIIAYLVAGFAVGPVGIGLVEGRQSIETISGLGLLLLLFMIGLEIDLTKILSAGRLITVTAAVQILGGCVIGLTLFVQLGFRLGGGALDALYLAVAGALSSTVIIVKILHEKRELYTLAGRITLGVLVLQDLCAILFLALQPNLKELAFAPLILAPFKAIFLVAAAFTISRHVLPPLFRAVAHQPELVLVGALAWCFMVAGLASLLDLSSEMGALIAGMAISTYPYTFDVAAKVISLRDFFLTLFFVALGMSVPEPSFRLLGSAMVLAVLVVASRFLTVFPTLYGMRQGHRVSLLPALNLSQVSEFSLVIMALGLKADHIAKSTFDSLAYAFVLLAVVSSYTVNQSEPLLRRMSALLKRLGLRDAVAEEGPAAPPPRPPSLFILGFYWTASSLLEEITRSAPDLLDGLAVIDFNPEVNQELRRRGVRGIYGDISHRETLLHAGVGEARLIVCTLPDSILKGTTNLRLLQLLREINPTAKIIVHAELLSEIPRLYEAGADYVSVPRLIEAGGLCAVIQAAQHQQLDQKRAEMDAWLKGRAEVIH